MNKQPAITDRTRQTFIDAFCILYSQKPLEKISIQEIARKAGYNRSTYYQYFLSLDDLLDYAEQDLLKYICEKRENESSDTEIFVKHLVTLYETKSIYIDAMLGNFGANRFIERVKANMQPTISEMRLPDDNPVKPYLMEFHISCTLSLFRLWLQRGKDLPLEEFLSLVSNLYMNGMSSMLA